MQPGHAEKDKMNGFCRFAVAEGDLITYLNVWKAWEDSGRNRKWAERNMLSQRVLLRAADIRGQLLYHLRSALPQAVDYQILTISFLGLTLCVGNLLQHVAAKNF